MVKILPPKVEPDELARFFEGVMGVVETTSYERLCLWQENKQHRKLPWKDNLMGYIHTVGEIGDMPVCIRLMTSEIDGHTILFFEPTSAVVDHRMIDKFFEETLPLSAFRGGDREKGVNETNAMNFCNVFPA
jgi:hypothetical protein